MKFPTMGMLYGMHTARIVGLALGSVLIASSMPSAPGQSTASGSNSETKGAHAVRIEDMFKYLRYAEPQLSPDGKSVVYQATKFTDPAKNAKSTNIYRVDLESGTTHQVTTSAKSDTHARFSPDGKRLLFESTRDGSSQLYILDSSLLAEAKQLTRISTGASTGIWSPDGKRVAFVSTIRPEFSNLPFEQSDAKNK
jgi:Tol biopolymer transport system component